MFLFLNLINNDIYWSIPLNKPGATAPGLWNTSPAPSYRAWEFLPPLVRLPEFFLPNYKVLHEARPQLRDGWHWVWQLPLNTGTSKACSMPLGRGDSTQWKKPCQGLGSVGKSRHPPRRQSSSLREETQSLRSPGAEVRLCCNGVTHGHVRGSGECCLPPGLTAPCSWDFYREENWTRSTNPFLCDNCFKFFDALKKRL